MAQPVLFALAGAITLTGCSAPVAEPGQGTASSAVSPASTPPPASAEMTWVERAPDDAGSSPLPLVIAIHGLGDAPDRFCRLFDEWKARARVACPRAFAKYGKSGWSWFPPGNNGAEQASDIGAAADRLATAIAALAKARPTAGKPIVVGFSQGGALSFAMAIRHPAAVRMAVPMGGWVPGELMPSKGAAAAPIVALHGEIDDRVPFGPTRDVVAALVAGGTDARLTSFPGVGHAIPPEVKRALYSAIEHVLDADSRQSEDHTPGAAANASPSVSPGAAPSAAPSSGDQP